MTVPIGALLGTDAATATRHSGHCQLCRDPIVNGERYAHTTPYDQLAHLRCIAAAVEQG
jgi:hypothetical protein